MIASFEKLSELVKQQTGIVLDADKQYVVESRLRSLARLQGHDNVAPLVHKIIETREPVLTQQVVDALTTNETFFFRDRTPFEQFSDFVLPYLLNARANAREISIWCNACSTGQEPYSLAMALDQMTQITSGWRIDIDATDVSHSVIEAARQGRYNQFEVQRGLPANVLLRYFNRDGEGWQIAEHLRSKVRFSNFNLLQSFEDRGLYDIIFCRNVLIYFDQATKKNILARLARATRIDGFLVLGSTETVTGADAQWVPSLVSPMLYVRADGPHAARSANVCAQMAGAQ